MSFLHRLSDLLQKVFRDRPNRLPVLACPAPAATGYEAILSNEASDFIRTALKKIDEEKAK